MEKIFYRILVMNLARNLSDVAYNIFMKYGRMLTGTRCVHDIRTSKR